MLPSWEYPHQQVDAMLLESSLEGQEDEEREKLFSTSMASTEIRQYLVTLDVFQNSHFLDRFSCSLDKDDVKKMAGVVWGGV